MTNEKKVKQGKEKGGGERRFSLPVRVPCLFSFRLRVCCKMGCEGCGDEGCTHCRCTVCGVSAVGANARPLRCAVCHSLTHAACASAKEMHVVPQFHCSTQCYFGVTLSRNRSFNVALSARLELKCDRLWQEMVATDTASYCRLRYRMWAEYFELEKHQLPMIPRCYDLLRNVRLQLIDLLSPEGQARLLCTLHPVDHPVGSAVALPAPRIWEAPQVPPGCSSDYVAEAAEVLRGAHQVAMPQ